MRYTHLTQKERYQISVLMKAGHNQTEITMILGHHKSTISHEINRNKGLLGYCPKQAQHLPDERQQTKIRPRINATG